MHIFFGSDTDIRVVISIDVEYKGSKKVSISIWRPHIRVDAAGEKELSIVRTVSNQVYSPKFDKAIYFLIHLALPRQKRTACSQFPS